VRCDFCGRLWLQGPRRRFAGFGHRRHDRAEDYTPQTEAAVDEAVYEINLAHDCLISVVIFGRRELEEGPLGESPLYKRILAEGVPL